MDNKMMLAWGVFGLYVAVTTWLAWRGMSKTKDLKGFALGNGDMGPVLVGITLAASIASTATFVINPGLVYHFGLSAFMHLGIAGSLGVTTALILFSKGFRKNAGETKALTLPHWIGARYGHPWMRTYFALLNLVLSITFIVLILKGSAIVMQITLGLSYFTSLVIIVLFVFSYILMGGTYAHAYTNALQGALMVIVAGAILSTGTDAVGTTGGIGGFFDRLAEIGPHLAKPVVAGAPLYASAWEVFGCGFIVSMGLVCQPHILTKSLYLKSDRDVNRYLLIAVIIGTVFSGLLLTGLFARVLLPAEVVATITGPDTVMPLYIANVFSPVASVLISVALLAAGMSTLDGILVSASTIAANDVYLGVLGEKLMPTATQTEREQAAFKASRVILVVMGVVGFALAYDPPKLVALFAQAGIYGLVASSLAPIALGIFVKRLNANVMFAAALAGASVHFVHYSMMPKVWNPAISATEGILVSFAVALIGNLVFKPAADAPARDTAA